MKFLSYILAFFACIFLINACENTKTANSVSNENKTTNNQNISANNTNISNNTANEISNIKSNSESETSDEKADFEGTAGITDKKYEIKSAALLKEVRTAQHEVYDRVTFEFESAEMPSYHIEYIDKPVRACGSGEVINLKGDGWLEIRFQPANAHTEKGEPTMEKRELTPNHTILKELKQTCDFEADVTWVLGVSIPNKYRVLELENPTRLAIDIKH